MLKSFPEAGGLSPSVIDLITRLAQLWAKDPARPQPTKEVCRHWDSLISDWAADRSMPLFIRKVDNNRGSLILHASGRQLVPTDNSPAQWAFASAVLGEVPSIEDIREAMTEDRIPVAMILKARERAVARYKCTLNRVVNPNSAGWKVAHIEGVGLSKRTMVTSVDKSILREHFRKLMAPANMFVIPLKYAGLGEIPEFCRAVRSAE